MSRPRSRPAPVGRGSAAAVGVGLVGVLTSVAVLVATLCGAVADQRRVESAADLAALAGAGAAQAGADPCGAAATAAARNGARLVGCVVEGEVVSVRVQRRTASLLGRRLTVTGRARAGPVSAT